MVFEKVLGHILNFQSVNHIFGKITNLSSVILLSFILFSCISTKPLYIEIPQKSKKEFPESIQSLLLVSRIVDDSYTDLEPDSLQRFFYKQNFNYDTIIRDIQVVDTTLQALGELLFESERYDIVIPENRFLDFEKNNLIAKEMSWDEINDLCEIFKTDAVLSLDYLKMKVFTSYTKNSEFDIRKNVFVNFVEAQMKISYDALFRVYDPIEERILYRKFMRDTIYWEDADLTVNALFNRFTPVKTAAIETGIAIALDISGEITPTWQNGKRAYFASGDTNLKEASQLVNSGEWESAIVLWKDTAEETKSKSLKSKAEYNIALGYEMLGDLDASVEWAIKSYNTMYRTNTVSYMEILKRRKNEINNQ